MVILRCMLQVLRRLRKEWSHVLQVPTPPPWTPRCSIHVSLYSTCPPYLTFCELLPTLSALRVLTRSRLNKSLMKRIGRRAHCTRCRSFEHAPGSKWWRCRALEAHGQADEGEMNDRKIFSIMYTKLGRKILCNSMKGTWSCGTLLQIKDESINKGNTSNSVCV